MANGETARYRQHPGIPGVDLLRARFVRHAFPPHVHEGYVIATITSGVEEFHHRGSVERVGPGGLALLNPEVPHTGHAGVPEGWTYEVLYPDVNVVSGIAEEVAGIRGTPAFGAVVVRDEAAARLVSAVHRAVEQDDALAADSLLRLVVGRLVRAYGTRVPGRAPGTAGASAAATARDLLEQRMADPPSLGQLAAEVGASPFSLARAFREAYGLPPHAWLTGARVRRAKRLLDTGAGPAEAAAEVGFHDQPHLNRHFTRFFGVPPGMYQRAARTYKTPGERPA